MNRRGFFGFVFGVTTTAVAGSKLKQAKITEVSKYARAKTHTEDLGWGTFTYAPYKVTLVGPRGGKLASMVTYGMLQPDGITIRLNEVRFPEFKRKCIVAGCIVSPVHSPHKEWRLNFVGGSRVLGKLDTAVVKDARIYFE